MHLRKHRKQRKRNESFIVTGETEREKEEIIVADHVNNDACDHIDPGEYTVFTLVMNGIKKSLEDNTIQMDTHMVEKNQLILQNDMNEKWCTIYKESDGLSLNLENLLSDHKTIKQFLKSKELQGQYLEKVFPQLLSTLQYNTTSGVFLVLANDQDISKEADYQGVFEEILIHSLREFRGQIYEWNVAVRSCLIMRRFP